MLVTLAQECTPLILRYEDESSRSPQTIAGMARQIGLNVPFEVTERIATKLSAATVARTIEQMTVDGLLGRERSAAECDPQTQWHPHHVGDGRVDKYTENLSAAQIAVVSYATRKFMQFFGYKPASILVPSLNGSDSVLFSLEGGGAAYLGSGFAEPEDWGVWTIADQASLLVPLAKSIEASISIGLQFRVGPALRAAKSGVSCEIWVNGRSRGILPHCESNSEFYKFTLCLYDKTVIKQDKLEISFRMNCLQSPAELGLSQDARRIGIGLAGLSILYV